MADKGTDECVAEDPKRSRRQLLTAAGGALGVAVAGSLISAGPAGATQGANTVTGVNNSETSVTTFTNTSAGNSGGVTGVGAGFGHGVRGDGGASGGIGVIGAAAGPVGTGVRGEGAGSGTGVNGVGGGTSGPGIFGAGGLPNGIGSRGTGAGNAAGILGVGGDSSGPGVKGSGGAPDGIGVVGQGRGTGAGVVATGGGSAGIGVVALGAAGGDGIHAEGDGIGHGVSAVGGAFGGAAVFAEITNPASSGNALRATTQGGAPVALLTGNNAQLRVAPLNPARSAPSTDTGVHDVGEILSDGTGNLWYCVADGTPGTWRQIAGANTAGAFHALPAPARVYDSRPGTAPSVPPKTPLAANTARTLDLTANNSGVPAGATAATVNLLLVNATAGNGNFTIWANGVPKPQANNMVWGGTAGRFSSVAVTALDATGKCQVLANLATDLVLDVVGYYL